MKIRRTYKHVILLALLAASIFMLCGFNAQTDMPYSGDIVFHEIALTIPGGFVRDSTQSNADLWLFEKGWYSKYIILSRSDCTGDAAAALDDYARYLQDMGVDVRRETFLQKDAVHSVYTRNDEFCQEMFFAHEGSLYAVALRKGDEAEFRALLDTVSPDPEAFIAERGNPAPDTRLSGIFGRIMDYFGN